MADPRTPRPPRSAGADGGGNGGRGRGGGIAAEAAASSARGALLVVAAVIVGVVLLQVVGNDDTDPGSSPNPTNGTVESTTTVPDGETTTPTDDTSPEKDPSKLIVQVLNGRGVQGVAGQMTEALREQGYTSILDPRDADPREGDVVMCRKRFQREGTTLVTHIGPGTQLEAFPDPLPTNADPSVECLVILGSAAQ